MNDDYNSDSSEDYQTLNNSNITYSRLIDNYQMDNIYINNNKIDNTNISYTWLNDAVVDNCYNCQSKFTLFNRKHHCRACGKIFCNKCSNFYTNLPHNYIAFPKKPKNFTGYIKKQIGLINYSDNKERVCLYCYEKITNLNALLKYIEVFELLKFNLLNLHMFKLVNKKWNQTSINILSKFKDIIYYPVGQELTDIEKNLIWNNRHFFSGHTKWLTILIKTINWSNKKAAEEVIKIINSKKIIHCKYINCCKDCSEEFEIETIIDLVANIIHNKSIFELIIKKLKTLKMKEFLIYLPILIYYMRFESDDYSYLSDLVIQNCLKENSIELINYFYWQLMINCEYNPTKYKNILEKFLYKIGETYTSISQKEINKSFNFIHILDNIPTNPKKEIVVEYLQYMMNNHNIISNECNLYLPIDPNFKCIDILYDEIDIKNSATAPIKIPFVCEKNKKRYIYNIIYKKEDIRTDMIIMNLIHMIDIILKKEENIDCNIKKYKIMPISNNSGIIEIIDNSETLYNISQNKKLSILNYIIEKNPNSKIDDLRKVFITSCAAYCVITYLLGVGDRHLDNIMVTDKGQLFHIDYSFILGNEPKIITVPKIRITAEMLDAIGGEHSSGYKLFNELVSRFYNCLRKHYNIFINMLMILSDVSDKYDKTKIKNEIINRFLLGQSHVEAELDIVTHISQSKTTHYGQDVVDFFHYHQKEKTLTNVIECANKFSSKVYGYFWGDSK